MKRKKAKRKQYDEVDELQSEIRELKAINRSLTKQLKKLSKGINRLEYEQALERLEDEQERKPQKKEEHVKSCPDCSSKTLKEISIAGRKFHRCDTCGYKSGKLN